MARRDKIGRYRRFNLDVERFLPSSIRHITVQQKKQLTVQTHVWSVGSSYAKLADQYYQDSRLWWVIAWYNLKPTESHNVVGDTIYIPFPLDKVIQFYRV